MLKAQTIKPYEKRRESTRDDVIGPMCVVIVSSLSLSNTLYYITINKDNMEDQVIHMYHYKTGQPNSNPLIHSSFQ